MEEKAISQQHKYRKKMDRRAFLKYSHMLGLGVEFGSL